MERTSVVLSSRLQRPKFLPVRQVERDRVDDALVPLQGVHLLPFFHIPYSASPVVTADEAPANSLFAFTTLRIPKKRPPSDCTFPRSCRTRRWSAEECCPSAVCTCGTSYSPTPPISSEVWSNFPSAEEAHFALLMALSRIALPPGTGCLF